MKLAGVATFYNQINANNVTNLVEWTQPVETAPHLYLKSLLQFEQDEPQAYSFKKGTRKIDGRSNTQHTTQTQQGDEEETGTEPQNGDPKTKEARIAQCAEFLKGGWDYDELHTQFWESTPVKVL